MAILVRHLIRCLGTDDNSIFEPQLKVENSAGIDQ
jgi:hypothetical protein